MSLDFDGEEGARKLGGPIFRCLHCGYDNHRYSRGIRGLQLKPPRNCGKCYKYFKDEDVDYHLYLPEKKTRRTTKKISEIPREPTKQESESSYNPNELLDIFKE